jgi:hypothetical protein
LGLEFEEMRMLTSAVLGPFPLHFTELACLAANVDQTEGEDVIDAKEPFAVFVRIIRYERAEAHWGAAWVLMLI